MTLYNMKIELPKIIPQTWKNNQISSGIQQNLPKSEKKETAQTNNSSNTPTQKNRIRSKCRKIIIGLIISLSALTFGYSLKEITSVPIAVIMAHYSITSVNSFSAQSILIGILPIGSVFGAIITKFLIKRFRRLTGIYIFTIVNILAVILINITTFTTLIIGRFIEGICIGYYSAIAPVYLKEIAPKELRRMLGLFFSFGKIVGVLISIALQLIFDALNVQMGWRVLLSMTALFSIIQAILIFFFGSDTPTEMIQKGEKHEAKKIIQNFYFEQYVNEVLHEYQQEYDAEQAKGKQTLSENPNQVGKMEKSKNQLNETTEIAVGRAETTPGIVHFLSLEHSNQNSQLKLIANMREHSNAQLNATSELFNNNEDMTGKKNNKIMNSSNVQVTSISQKINKSQKEEKDKLTYEDKKNNAYCLCLHLNIIRHFSGGSPIISQGGIFIGQFNKTLGTYTSLIINSIQFVFIIIGFVYIQKLIGKRPLFLFSITALSIINIAVAIAMFFENVAAMLTLLCVYIMIYGGSFIAPIWAYPSEIMPASQLLMPNIFHWVGMALSTLVPPLVMNAMPDNNPYPVFIFFGIYGLLSLIHVLRYLRESDGLTYKEIIKSFV